MGHAVATHRTPHGPSHGAAHRPTHRAPHRSPEGPSVLTTVVAVAPVAPVSLEGVCSAAVARRALQGHLQNARSCHILQRGPGRGPGRLPWQIVNTNKFCQLWL